MTFTLASVSLVSDIVGIIPVGLDNPNGRQRPEYTTESKQGSPCSSGFHILLACNNKVLSYLNCMGPTNSCVKAARLGGVTRFPPLSISSYFIKCERLKALNLMFLTWSLTLLTKLNQATSDNEVKIIQGDCCIIRGRN